MRSLDLLRTCACFVSVASLLACATATDPDVTVTTDGGVHDSSTVFDSTGNDTNVPPTDTSSGDVACSSPKKVCGGKCVDVATDNGNCGDCGKTCGDGTACSGGTCGVVGCIDPKITCPDGACVDLLSDPNHCGTCDNKCGLDGSGTPKICKDATCELDCTGTTKAVCPGATTCVDLNTDDANCGKCGNACPTGEKCAAGTCIACASPGTICGTKCVDTTSDGANCGKCGNVCAAGHSCSGGACVCPTSETDCSGTCKDLTSDGSNCGACGRVCASGTFCNASTCSSTCPTGKSGCGGSCIDTTSDPSNCGGCGKTCGATAPYCSGGTCVAMPKCDSGTLQVLYYGDGDAAKETPYLPTGAIATSASGTTWSSMTTADFSKYQLVILGGEGGTIGVGTPYDNANATKGTWGPAINGRIVVHEMDAVVHCGYGTAGACTFTKAALQWAATGPGTNLYVAVDIGCRHYDFLSTFGTFVTQCQTTGGGFSGDDVHIVDPTNGTVIGSTDASMSKWSYTYHGGITGVPAGFTTVANGTSGTTTAAVLVTRDVACAP